MLSIAEAELEDSIRKSEEKVNERSVSYPWLVRHSDLRSVSNYVIFGFKSNLILIELEYRGLTHHFLLVRETYG